MKVIDQSVVVTGGASGLGLAVVEYFSSLGAQVASLDISYPQSVSNDNKVLCVHTDVCCERSVSAALAHVQSSYGSIDILVNAAGITAQFRRTYGKDGPYPLDLFRKVLDVNLVGSFNCARLAAGFMADNPVQERGERGVIINVASITALDGPVGTIAYTAAKAGVQGMTLTMARDLAKYGIRVCTIAPGSFDTPMLRNAMEDQLDELVSTVPFPNDRLGDPKDFAALVESICKNPMMNGETIRLDGAARLAHC